MNKTQEKAIRKELNVLIRLFKKANETHKVNTVYGTFKIKGSVDIQSESWFDDDEFEIYESTVKALNSQTDKLKKFILFDIDSLDTTDFINICGLREKFENLYDAINTQLEKTCDVIKGIITVDARFYDLEEELIYCICVGGNVDECMESIDEISLGENTPLRVIPKTKQIAISTDYSAIITEGSTAIKVGCQTVYINDVRTLIKLWDELNPSD